MEQNQVQSDDFSQIADKLDETLTLEQDNEEDYGDDDDDEEDEENFEFCVVGGDLSSPVSAEEIFHNGQIRPISPFCGEESPATTSYGPPVRNLFVVSQTPENDDVAEGPYCAWSPEKGPEMSRKSNSTGFSRLWRVKDLLVRSNSDGKDAFVFLAGKSNETTSFSKDSAKKKKNKVSGERSGETASCGGERKGKKKSAYEVFYGKEQKKGGKSYLPYRQDLVGFFTNVSGMSRNVHPY